MGVETYLIDILTQAGITAVATLPCGKIRPLLELLPTAFKEVPLTREEDGVGLCVGAYLAGVKMALVMQSSGVGNSINALMSLATLFRIPLPILVSWRGVWREQIFAQTMMGEALPALLDGLKLPYLEVREASDMDKVKEGLEECYRMKRPYVFLLSPKIWTG